MKRKVVTLCGSTRFFDAFMKANYDETMKGHIVLSIGFYPGITDGRHMEGLGCNEKQKIELDLLYFDKISMSDEILVLNVGGYIGESTRREIGWALLQGKHIRFLEALIDSDWWVSKHAKNLTEEALQLVEKRLRGVGARVS